MLQIQLTSFNSRKPLLTKMIFFQITIPPGAHEVESLSDEIKRLITDTGHYTGDEHPFLIKPFLIR